MSLDISRSLTERFYHPELDVLRFFAFFLAFVHHSFPHQAEFYAGMGVSPAAARAMAALGGIGSFGVTLFFLLSAYLITELLIRERQRFGQIELRAFYIRRVLRIWPLYFIFLALAWTLQWFVPSQHIGWRAALSFLLLGGNWWVFFVGFPSSVIFPLWSISVEEQFYLVWPVAMRRLGGRGLLWAAAVMLAAANLTRWYLAAHNAWESSIWTHSFVQLDAIALGIVVAVLLRGRSPRLQPLQRVALLVLGIACFAVSANYFQIKQDPLTVSRVLLGYPIAVLGALAVFLAALGILDGQPLPGKRGNSHAGPQSAAVGKLGEEIEFSGWSIFARSWQRWGTPLLFLGRVSYGLFIFHILGLLIADYSIHNETSSLGRYLLRNAMGFALAVIFATLSYRWLEMPFLTLKQRFTHILSRPGG